MEAGPACLRAGGPGQHQAERHRTGRRRRRSYFCRKGRRAYRCKRRRSAALRPCLITDPTNKALTRDSSFCALWFFASILSVASALKLVHQKNCSTARFFFCANDSTERANLLSARFAVFPILSAMCALEFAHEAGECFDGGVLDGIVKRDAHAADGAVAGRADEAGRGGFGSELLFHCFQVPGGFHVLGGR